MMPTDISLTPSILIEHRYCPRYTYYEHVMKLPQHEEKYGKVLRGRRIHEEKLVRNKEYLRKRIGAVARHNDCYLSMPGLRGIIDEVLELEDGTFAPLDYKFAKWPGKVYDTYRLQLTCYAMLVAHNFGAVVDRGYLVYVRSRHRLECVTIGDREKSEARRLIFDARNTIAGGRYPEATKYPTQCLSCTYRNICPR